MTKISAASSVGKVLGSLLFVVFLGAAVMAGALAALTDEQGVRSVLSGVFDEALRDKYSEQDLDGVRIALQRECGPFAGTIVQDFGGISVEVDCSAVRLGQASDLPALFTDAYMDKVYFQTYSCSFMDCFSQAQGAGKAVVLFSKHANSFFITMMWVFGALAIIGVIMIFASIRHAFSALKVIGIDMALAGLPAFFVGGLRNLVPIESVPAGVAAPLDSVFSFLSAAYLAIFGIGIILAVAGFVLASKWPAVKARKAATGERVQRSFTPRLGTEAQYRKKGGHGVHYSDQGQPYIKDRFGRVRFIRKSKKK